MFRLLIISFISILLTSCSATKTNTFMDVNLPKKEEQIYKEAKKYYNEKLYPLAFYRFMQIRNYQDSTNYMKSIYQLMSRKTLNPQENHLKFIDESGVERIVYYDTQPLVTEETGNQYYSYTNTIFFASALKSDYSLELNEEDSFDKYGLTYDKNTLPTLQTWGNILQFDSSNGFYACALDRNGTVKHTYNNKDSGYELSDNIVQVQCGKFEYMIVLTDNGIAYQKYADYMKGEGLDIAIYQDISLLPTGRHPLGLSNSGDLVRFEPLWENDIKLEKEYHHLSWIFNTWNYSKYILLMDGNGILHMPGADEDFNQLLTTITDVVEANYFGLEDVVVRKIDGSILRILKKKDNSLSVTRLWGRVES